MFRQRIPGLSYIPMESSHDEDSVKCVGFNLQGFTIPGNHKYGNCRPVEEFEKIKTIAHGEFGTVYKVRDRITNDVYALKKIRIPKTGHDNLGVLPQNALRQINNLKLIKHLNIVNLKEVVVGKDLERNYLLLDYCEFSLQRVIDHVETVFLQHRHIKNIMHQLLAGLQYIHSFNVLHRDLCPKNVLFTEQGILKIADFGSSRAASNGDMTPDQALRCYRAPEILLGSTKYTKAVDVWAVGCIFAEMIRQKPLFRGKIEGDVVRSMLHILGSPTETNWPGYSELPVPKHYRLKKQPYNRIPKVFSNQTLATISYLMKIFQYNPASRPTVEEIMEDPYYQEHPHDCQNAILAVTLRMSRKS